MNNTTEYICRFKPDVTVLCGSYGLSAVIGLELLRALVMVQE